MSISRRLCRSKFTELVVLRDELDAESRAPVARRRNKIEERMDSLVLEARVPLDPALLGEDVVVLLLEVADNGGKSRFVVDVVAKAGRIADGQTDMNPVFVELDSLLLDLDLGPALWRTRASGQLSA